MQFNIIFLAKTANYTRQQQHYPIILICPSHLTRHMGSLTAQVLDVTVEADCRPGGDLQPPAPGVHDGVVVLELQPLLDVIIAVIILLISVVGVIVIVVGGVLG